MNKLEAQAAIEKVYPDLVIENFEFLGSGFDSDAFLLNQSYVFKFPRHARAARNLYKEAVVLREIKDQVPLKVPEICFVGESNRKHQLEFVGHEKINGVPLTADILQSLTTEEKENLNKELAAFFKALHEIKLPESIEGLEVDKKTKAAYEYKVIKQAAYPLLPKSVQLEIDEVYRRILQQDFHYQKCLIHNDFGASNVYYDQATNQICGLIDFGDVAIYDRDMEFVCLMFDYEEGFNQEFVQKLMVACEIDPNEIQKKLGFVDFYNQLENIYLGQEFGMTELFEDSVAEIQQGLKGYEENILLEDKTIDYL
ncbi:MULTISPECIES: phosphotransferase family protein [Enterococcus]|uniref:phosphotransferase family protein n=1 Tax=Enterococcus TaxID=1350 RepID=UPI0022E78896|nr:aminoglycoside phosphotransferase family protein [Enterococcus malodoratus]